VEQTEPTPMETTGKDLCCDWRMFEGKKKVIAARRLVRHRKVDSGARERGKRRGVLHGGRSGGSGARRRVPTTGMNDGESTGHLFPIRVVWSVDPL
jgi:hypothetical protein